MTIGFLDRHLGRFTMYRLVTVVLLALAAVAVALAAAGELDPSIFPVGAMVLTLLVVVAASLAVNLLVGRLVGARPHLESSLVTALILWFLYWPATTVAGLAWLAMIAALAQVSKYLVAWRGRHLVNPAAAGVVLSLLIGRVTGIETLPFTAWWAGSAVLFGFVLVGALLVLYRTRRLGVGLAFVAVAYPLTVWGLTSFGSDLGQALQDALYAYPIVWFAGFMLSEPLTLPPRRWQQCVAAIAGALVFAWPLASFAATGQARTFAPFESTYELALVVTGLIAFGFRQGSRTLVLQERRPAGDAVEYVFRADRPLAFVPGQYVELDVPHRGVDARGRRRMLSVASVPGQEVVLATRHPEPGSSFKRALDALAPGDRVRVTSVHGDFVWPADGPLLLVAGGIGITPFLSQLAAEPDRDVHVVYGVRSTDDIAFADRLAVLGDRVHVIAGDALTVGQIAAAVPDLADRTALVSGTPAMVDALAGPLRHRVKRLRTDHFLGY